MLLTHAADMLQNQTNIRARVRVQMLPLRVVHAWSVRMCMEMLFGGRPRPAISINQAASNAAMYRRTLVCLVQRYALLTPPLAHPRISAWTQGASNLQKHRISARPRRRTMRYSVSVVAHAQSRRQLHDAPLHYLFTG